MAALLKRFFLTGLLIILAACTSTGGDPLTLTEENNGQSVQIKNGQRLNIALEGNPTTGYNWEVDSINPAILKQVGEPEFNAASGALGASGVITLQFQAISQGDTTLRLIYHRPWEQGMDPEKTFEATIVVK